MNNQHQKGLDKTRLVAEFIHSHSLGHYRRSEPIAEDPPVAEVILSHPFGGT